MWKRVAMTRICQVGGVSGITCCRWLASEEFDSKPSGKIVGSTQH